MAGFGKGRFLEEVPGYSKPLTWVCRWLLGNECRGLVPLGFDALDVPQNIRRACLPLPGRSQSEPRSLEGLVRKEALVRVG